jgi:PAS domain S-box-containing protein
VSVETGTELHADIPSASSPVGFSDRKELGAFAFERTRMPMVVADAQEPDFPIVLANHAFLELTGYSAEDIVGWNCRFLQGKGTSPLAIAQVRLAIEERRDITIELLNYKKDGTPFWNQLHLSHIRDDGGEVAYIFASQVEVTEFRKAQTLEATEHRLLMEVDHRAKNVLAIVESVVRLSKSEDSAKYAAAVQHRVQALSVAHGLLSERGWNPVPLKDVIRTQIKRYRQSGVAMSGPDIPVPAVVVQPLALVFHELVSNAAVHGALSKPGGRLSLTWKRTGDDEGFILTWQEVGVAPPRSRDQERFWSRHGEGRNREAALRQAAARVGRRWSSNSHRGPVPVRDRTNRRLHDFAGLITGPPKLSGTEGNQMSLPLEGDQT